MARSLSKSSALRTDLTVDQLDPAGIRAQWVEATGTQPPRYVSRTLLVRMLADRIQVAQYGGVSTDLRRRLLRIAEAVARGDPIPNVPRQQLKPGTTLVRDWQGTRVQVEVLESGFTYNGQKYKSLSEIARAITGTRWSGPAFFGLKVKPKAKLDGRPGR